MKQIAEAAGVSVMTVSRVLRNAKGVNEATRRHVGQIAEELGYESDPALGALVAYRSNLKYRPIASAMGLILGSPWKLSARESMHYTRLARYLNMVAARHGYRLDTHFLDENAGNTAVIARILRARGIEGLIFLVHPALLQKLDFDWSHFCHVCLFSSPSYLPTPCIRTNPVSIIRLAWERTKAHGYKKPWLVMPEIMMQSDSLWHDASLLWDKKCENLGGGGVCPVAGSAGLEQLKQLIQSPAVDAIIYTNGEEYLAQLEKIGFVPNGSIGFAALDLLNEQDASHAGIVQDRQQIAYLAVHTLDNLLQQKNRGLLDRAFTVDVMPYWKNGTLFPVRT